ncbi:MAG: AAA family ATPase, partial [Candidatus Falkowbacteria bacterium]|nr:AAA family ATPase [Candidatus Falkowbacteria bacterium]
MGKIISIVNQKGGVGKTTTSINLSAYLAEFGKHVCLVDLDPQGNATSGIGIDQSTLDIGIYDALIGEKEVNACLKQSNHKRLHVIPATQALA